MSKIQLGSTRLTGADGVRAIACLSVILHHLSQRLVMPAQKPWLQEVQSVFLLGNSGVSLFFLLSGFLLSFPFWSAYLEAYAILFGVLLLSAPFSVILGRLLDNRFFRFTAKISFGLYIWHYLFITLIEKYGIKDYHYSGIRDVWRWLGISISVVAISYAAATISYYVIEQPFINWSKGKPFFRRKRTDIQSGKAV